MEPMVLYQVKFSTSSLNAMSWASTRAFNEKRDVVTPEDVLVGVSLAHGSNSHPLVLLAHFNLLPEALYRQLGFDPSSLPSYPNTRIPPLDLSPETTEVINTALLFGERFNSAEEGRVHLRALFGALLSEPGPAQRALTEAMAPAPVSFDELVKAYHEYLAMPKDTAFQVFLGSRFPLSSPEQNIQQALQGISPTVSGFSSDTRSDRDLVGIGAEVDAFAYLITAKRLQPPLAIGLFGDWGSGKSYFMQSLKDRVFSITENAARSGKPQKDLSVYKYIVQIEFNAWHYVEGELWASLVEHILHNLQTRPGDDPSLLEQRQQVLIDQMKAVRAEQSLAKEAKEELEKDLREKQVEVQDLERERDQAVAELNKLKTTDVANAIRLTNEDRAQLNKLLGETGANAAYTSAVEFIDALDRMKAELQRGGALAVLMRRRGWQWTAGLVAVLLSGPLISLIISWLAQNQIPAVTNALLSLSGMLASLTVILRSGAAELNQMLNRVDAARQDLDKRRLETEKDYADRIAAKQKEVDEASRKYEEAASVEKDLADRIAALEQELQQITPRRVLLDFIRERVESQDYRRWLGVPALIRRDFDQLSQLIKDQNADFLETDDGKVPEEPTHNINRIVLYIDDLDRCPPQRVTEVLQAVHLLLAFPLFVVVVAVDSRWLAQSLQKHYDGLLAIEGSNGRQSNGAGPRATPHDYLEKIFQIPFWVRPLDETARKRIVQGLVEGSLVDRRSDNDDPGEDNQPQSLQPEKEQKSPSRVHWRKEDHLVRELKQDAQPETNPSGLDILDVELTFMEDLRSLLGLTPRSVKRFVNVYWLIKTIASSQVTDFVSDEAFVGFKRVQFLLAMMTGLPAIASDVFGLILAEKRTPFFKEPMSVPREGPGPKVYVEKPLDPKDTLKTLVDRLRQSLEAGRNAAGDITSAWRELDRLESWLLNYDEGKWQSLELEQLQSWAVTVARFSYRMQEY